MLLPGKEFFNLGSKRVRLAPAFFLAAAILAGCAAGGGEGTDAGPARMEAGEPGAQLGASAGESTLSEADRQHGGREPVDERTPPGEDRPDGSERESAGGQTLPEESGSDMRESSAWNPRAPESGGQGNDQEEPDWTIPEKLDELPDAGVALYMAFDETGNNPRLLLEIDGERREVLRPDAVRWAYLNEADADHDGTVEIVITYSLGGGTGFSDGRMAVFRRDFTGIPFDEPLIALRKKMDMSMDHAKREIVLKAEGRSWRFPFPDEETDWWPEPYIGNVTGFSVRGDRLYSYVGLQASNSAFVADLYLGYVWDGKRLVTTDPEVHVPWQTTVPFQYEDEELGLSVRVPAGWFVDTGAFGEWSHAGEGFTILVEGHPENVIWNEVEDWITVTVPKENRSPAKKRATPKAKEAWEQVDVKMESGDEAVLYVVRVGESVELTFWSEKAEAVGMLREETFKKHRDAVVDMLASLES
jgi:hypothetical protein